MTYLPRIYQADDGSVAFQLLDRLQYDVYELLRVGSEMAKLNMEVGHLVPGAALESLRAGPRWHEMRPAVRDTP